MSLFGLSLGLVWYSAPAEGRDIRLPDIGDPASTVLSPAEEQKLGAVILGQIRSSLNVINDPELDTYIQSLGTRLVTAGINSDLNFTFLIIAAPSINAFATPGGVIAVNTGLIQATKNESELAGVIAHEIAHVKQRHLARAYAFAKQVSVATALGVLASVAAMALGSTEVGSAGLHSAIAAGTQSQLTFTRTNEQEADRVGMELLANAAYDPQGMPRFFERLHKRTQLNAGPALEFLSTHPVTLSRISDTRNRASQYQGEFSEDSPRFQYAKARLLGLTTSPHEIVNAYEKTEDLNKAPNLTAQYTYALALMRLGNGKLAIKVLKRIKERESEIVPIDLALAQAYSSINDYPKAVSILRRLNQIYPNHESIVYYLAQSLIDMGKPMDALMTLDNLIRTRHHNPPIDSLKARAAAEAKLPGISHESMAEYYIAYGQYGAAMEQFELALREQHIDAVTQARIRSKRKTLKSLHDRR